MLNEPTAVSEPTVFVVDDDPAMRQSLCWLLQSVGWAVETYAAAEEFLDRYDPARPGCLVLDVRMHGMGGLALQDELAARHVPLPIIIITAYAEVPVAVRALKAGALEFLEKPFSDQLLVDRVRTAIELDRRRRSEDARSADARARVGRLTHRERQVMDLVCEGKPNKAIAVTLGIREKTVEVHRAHLMKKLRVSSVAALIHLAFSTRATTGNPEEPYRKFPD